MLKIRHDNNEAADDTIQKVAETAVEVEGQTKVQPKKRARAEKCEKKSRQSDRSKVVQSQVANDLAQDDPRESAPSADCLQKNVKPDMSPAQCKMSVQKSPEPPALRKHARELVRWMSDVPEESLHV